MDWKSPCGRFDSVPRHLKNQGVTANNCNPFFIAMRFIPTIYQLFNLQQNFSGPPNHIPKNKKPSIPVTEKEGFSSNPECAPPEPSQSCICSGNQSCQCPASWEPHSDAIDHWPLLIHARNQKAQMHWGWKECFSCPEFAVPPGTPKGKYYVFFNQVASPEQIIILGYGKAPDYSPASPRCFLIGSRLFLCWYQYVKKVECYTWYFQKRISLIKECTDWYEIHILPSQQEMVFIMSLW